MKQLIRDILREHTREIGEVGGTGIKLTTDEFINRSNKKHHNKYDYSKSVYVNQKTPVTITCPIHGDFLQSPQHHMNGSGCQKCKGVAKLTNQEFIDRSNKEHKNFYDYSKTNYVNSSTKVKIICPIHGEFSQSPVNHVRGAGCPKCGVKERGDKKKLTTDDFIKRSIRNHGEKYIYSKVDYQGSDIPVIITCPIHGDFLQSPQHHMNGSGCPKCASHAASERYTKGTLKFINQAKKIHGDYYDYSNVDYKNNNSYVKIVCPKHGEFLQNPKPHLNGAGCPKCAGFNKTSDDFIEQSKKIHGDKYEYFKVNYSSARNKVIITCPIHGDFLQEPLNHLNGAGCPSCNESKGEKLINKILVQNNIELIRQKRFIDCTNQLKGRSCNQLPFDFYLPNLNTCIEYDGEQHFKPVIRFGGEDGFIRVQKSDKLKNQYCKKNGIKLIRIPYTMKKEDIEPYILQELGL
jgi:Zn finger protein HypA/HybF involved in hydrogenase expression